MSAERTLLGLTLTATAAWIDAIGFLRLHGFYVSYMSGNTTQFGVALSDGDWRIVAFASAVLALFFVGSFCGGLSAGLSDRWSLAAILAFEVVLLAAALALFMAGREQDALLVLPLAMGVQNGAVYQFRPGATTFVTGNLFRAGHELGRSLVGVRDTAWLPQLLTWLSFAVGAAAGAFASAHLGMFAVAVPLGVAAICAIIVAAATRPKEMTT